MTEVEPLVKARKLLLRRADVMRWLGLSPGEFRGLVENGVLKPVRFPGYRVSFFRRDEVARDLGLEDGRLEMGD